jgi:hypothetical protein
MPALVGLTHKKAQAKKKRSGQERECKIKNVKWGK